MSKIKIAEWFNCPLGKSQHGHPIGECAVCNELKMNSKLRTRIKTLEKECKIYKKEQDILWASIMKLESM